MARPKNLPIDGKKLDQILAKTALPNTDISKFVLGKGDAYLADCIRNNNINEETFELLCEFLKIDKKEVLLDETVNPKEQTQEDIDIIVGLNKLYNLQSQMLTEIKTQNILLKELTQQIKDTKVTVNNVNSNVATTTEKVKAIFTEVKYNNK